MNDDPGLAELPQLILDWIDLNSPNIIGVWDSDMELLFMTKSVISILGYKPVELLGEKWRIIFSKDDQMNLYKNIDNRGENKPSHVYMTNDQGEHTQFEMIFDRLIDTENNVLYFIGSFRNIPDHKETKEMLVHSEKMSIAGQLAAGVAHEIRNPLTSLKGFLQLLQAGVDQKEVYYQIMSEEIERIESITSELLFISKPLTDQKKIESLHSMIKDVIMLLQSQAHLKNIKIDWLVSEELYTYCDRSQIKQVLINIIKNAIEATEEDGMVKVEVHLDDEGRLEIDIIDEGPGIPSDIFEKIGEPFFTTKQSGTGLGLMITKQILEKQNGRLFIVKSNENGSIFRITLPIVTESYSCI